MSDAWLWLAAIGGYLILCLLVAVLIGTCIRKMGEDDE